MMNRRGALGAFVSGVLGSLGAGEARAEKMGDTAITPPDPTETIPLWPNGAPGGEGVRVEEKIVERGDPKGLKDRAQVHTRVPKLVVFRPRKANGAAVMLIPGGGYERAYEGRDLAPRGYALGDCDLE